MIDMKRCEKGHFYDASKFAACPYCNSAEGTTGVNLFDANAPIPPTMPVGGAQNNNAGGYGDYGKTMPIGSAPAPRPSTPMPDEDIKTISVIKKEVHNEDNVGISPVVGWLVCIEGKEKGRDYRIFAGNNFIGRSDTMDICIRGDETISREKHACVSYDFKKNRFNIYQGDSHGLVYVNDETVFVPQLLNPYDIIELGKTKLMFVPFCSEKFVWSDNPAAGAAR